MKQSLRIRYTKMNWQQQLGNMASTLARVANNVMTPAHDEIVSTCLHEAACFIEWCAPTAPAEFLLELAAMQRELLTWHRLWPIEATRSLLALHARNQSDRILQIAGFYNLGDASSVVAQDTA